MANRSSRRNCPTEHTFLTLLSGDTHQPQGLPLALMCKGMTPANHMVAALGHVPIATLVQELTAEAVEPSARTQPGAS
ncbi:hypothetical protein PS467_36080 [Streptomyces luomodiensis]|uniref:Transposase n=1 Tax=Streptomyces luomodiensis TaxID=3026192 RepID=A0ABY9VEK1_9ACTN|nr:hypothetical protein [Streptomyces sp. SCA4-21]WNF00360.1 hypothetical protein PS467_36080 [Streptomyces sp. SCA4-21]